MTRYVIRRLLQAIPTLIGISIFSFLLAHAAPGDPYTFICFNDPNMSKEVCDLLRYQKGLDQPLPLQYVNWATGVAIREGDQLEKMQAGGNDSCSVWNQPHVTVCDQGGGILRGDMGVSFRTDQPVWDRLKERVPATLELGIVALFLSLILGIPLGLLSALYRGSIFDNLVRFFSVIGQAVPDFWAGLLLIYLFGVYLRILPTGGRSEVVLIGDVPLWERLNYLILPSFVLAFGGIAFFSRIMRTEVLEVINTDYIRTAKAKGLSGFVVLFVHSLRNALIPMMTSLGPAIFGVLGGAVVIERIFSWPGLGRLTLESAINQDFPVVLGAVMFFAVFTILGNLLSDILYGVVDPRVHLS